MNKKRPNLNRTSAQKRAAEPWRSAWVSANAGTGKTHVLVDRIARLLLAGNAPEKILCLTFTKTGAAEMATRISAQLGRWAVAEEAQLSEELHALEGAEADGETMTRARHLFARVLDTPGGLKIRTIHAFCEGLLGRFPIEAGVAPHFSVIDERTAAELLDEAREHIFERCLTAPGTPQALALSHLAGLVNEDALAGLMRELTTKRARLKDTQRHFDAHGGLVAALNALVGLNADESNDDAIITQAVRPGVVDEIALTRAARELEKGKSTSQKNAAKIKEFLAMNMERRKNFFRQAYAPLFVTNTGETRKKLTTAGAQGAEEILRAEQTRVRNVLEKLRARATADATVSLLTFALAIIEQYEHLKRARAVLDYDDLIERTRALLNTADNGVGWVHYKLDGGIDHILVDESQDTSAAQWDVVRHLAEDFYAGLSAYEERATGLARSMFAVGDEKQSIYSFQGADPREFARMRAHFQDRAEAAGHLFSRVPLITSFRSTRAVLNLVDRVFAQPGAADGLTFAGEHVAHEVFRDGEAGMVELWPTFKPVDEVNEDPWDVPLDYHNRQSPEVRLSETIADTIKGWLDGGERLESENRPLREGDILILLRNRGRFAKAMVKSLKRRAIAVAGADRMVLNDQLAVMDLLAMGRFAVLPEDDLSLAEVLKSPLVGLDEEALFTLAHARTGSLWAELRRRHDERDDFTRAFETLRTALARADSAPPYEFYGAMLQNGARQALVQRLGRDAQDPLDEFLALSLEFERTHTPSLQGFLQWMSAAEQNIKRDLETSGNEVRVMTVHGAKGLEAPVVFLADTCQIPSAHHDAKVQWAPQGCGVLWSPHADTRCDAFRTWVEDEALNREREYRRLLYVAMTRARDRLYITGFEDKNGRKAGCWYDLILPVMADLGKRVAGPESGEDDTTWRYETPQEIAPDNSDSERTAHQIAPPPAWIDTPAPHEDTPSNPLTPSAPALEDPPAFGPFSDQDQTRFKRGLLVHKLLETLPDLPPDARRKTAQAWLAQPAHALSAPQQADIVRETMAVLENPQFRDVFTPNSLCEVALSGVVNGQVVCARLDRLALTAQTVTLVDYKTNRPAPTDPACVPEAYLRQMARYKTLLAEIYPGREIRTVLLWTDGPHAMLLSDELLRLA